MASNKRSARAKQRAAFEAGFDGNAMGDLFTRERERKDRLDAEHEAALRRKACESKNRYSSKAGSGERYSRMAPSTAPGPFSLPLPLLQWMAPHKPSEVEARDHRSDESRKPPTLRRRPRPS